METNVGRGVFAVQTDSYFEEVKEKKMDRRHHFLKEET